MMIAITDGDNGGRVLVPWSEFRAHNAEDAPLIAELRRLQPRRRLAVGGGAWALSYLQKIGTHSKRKARRPRPRRSGRFLADPP